MSGIPGDTAPAPSEEQVRLLVYQTMEQMFRQSQASANVLLAVQARLAGVEAVTPIVDANQNDAQVARMVQAQKELLSHMYEKAQQYVVVIVAGAFAAYFSTLSIVSIRMPDRILEASAFLMTIALSIFVFYEVFALSWTSYRVMRGDVSMTKQPPRYMKIIWGVALLSSITIAMMGIALSLWAYFRGIGAAS